MAQHRDGRLAFCMRGLLLTAAAILLPLSSLRADTFRLASGGQVQGEWLNKEEMPLVRYVIRQPSGVMLKLMQEQVREHLRELPAEREYEERAQQTPDTVEGQWKLAEWCRDHHLMRQRTSHLERVIELDPNHQTARALLGFAFVGGRWTTKQDLHHSEGFEFYKGRWRTSQEIELMESRSKRELAEKAWLAKLVRLRSHLGSDKSAADTIIAIKDPAAIPALSTMLSRERLREVKMLFIDVLENMQSGDAVQVLVRVSLSDPDEEVYHYCIDKIVRLKIPHVADSFISALKDSSNPVVNRAAMALARIDDATAISPLIDALITIHQRTLPSRVSPDATAASFSADGGTSFLQNDGPKVIVARVQNQEVLAALTKLTKTTFGYDQRAWRLWYDQEKRAQAAKQEGSVSKQ
ncbi:MAG: HEAT repeat domain-containing protein [Planctomycetales bacterium]|nr:HEAT repeat domain-containing protein [Planctomycetales bacterium]